MDLNLFAFDYDLTFVVFFLDADEKVYARYGARDGRGPDELQSLDGLRYTMTSVLAMHQRKDPSFAPRDHAASKTTSQLSWRMRRCYHCHNVREALDAELRRSGKWERHLAWRHPLPDNLGLEMEVDRGNVVKQVKAASPASRAGVKAGDLIRLLGGVPVHSIADAQFALDRAPVQGKLALTWERAGKAQSGTMALAEGWRRSDISWRPSMRRMVPTLPLFGTDLSEAEKKALGLPAAALAFRQRKEINRRAEAAGIRAGDVIVGVDQVATAGMDASDLRGHVRRNYLVGDQVKIHILREGKRQGLLLTLAQR